MTSNRAVPNSIADIATLTGVAAPQLMDPSWQNITDPIFHWAAVRPNAPAFHQGPQTVTYSELAGLVAKAAVHLASYGIGAGERVAINLTNSIDHFILTLGLLRLGATTMEIPYGAPKPPAPELLAKFAVQRIFIEPIAAPVAGFPSIKVDAGWRDRVALAQGDRRSDDNGDGIFTISMTSGTTGEPKGSLTTHRQYFQRMRAYTDLFAESACSRRNGRQIFCSPPASAIPRSSGA